MGVTPAEGSGQREKEQQDAGKAEQCCAPRVPFSLALQGQVTPELEAWLSLQRWQRATAEALEVPAEEARQVPRSAEQTEASEMAWRHRKQSQR